MTNTIRKAADSLPGHWLKGNLSDNNGNYCAVGHLYRAFGADENCSFDEDADVDLFHRQWAFVEQVVDEFTNGEFDDIPAFNDDPTTTEADVVALLEKAAVRWDETHG